MLGIKKIDHVVITTININRSVEFYTRLGFEIKTQWGRYEYWAGDFKINVHLIGSELSPHADNIVSGSADICFEVTEPLSICREVLEKKGFILETPILERHGVKGPMHSLYLKDPDGNLLELCYYGEMS